MKKILLFFSVILYSCQTNNEPSLSLNNLFQNDMILQHESVVPIWGYSGIMKEIEIETSWGEKLSTKTDDKGYWKINLNTPRADRIPHTIMISSERDKLEINNVLLGEVWLASGQSNMGWRMKQTLDSERLMKEPKNSEIRMITVERDLDLKPKTTFRGEWSLCNSKTIPEFSAVGYFFAKKLHEKLNIPIGIINSSVGGTPAEAWANVNNLKKVEGFEDMEERMKISTDPKTEYNQWIDNHNFIDRSEFINKSHIRYANVSNKSFSKEKFDDDHWESRSIEQILTTFEKKKVDLTKYGPYHNLSNDFDGIMWIRKKFKIDEIKFDIAEFDIGEFANNGDFYSIFINGELVGRKNNWPKQPSKYKIEKGILKKGTNTLAIRFIDFYGDGGPIKDTKRGLYLDNKKIISFDGTWKSRVVGWLTNENLYPLDLGFDEVVFPSPMRISKSQGSHTILNNSMIHPLGEYAIKGVIWYQGEGNRTRAKDYKSIFSAVIDSFREQWDNNELPFYYVQLAPFGDIANKRRSGAELVAQLREAQRLTLEKNNVGMAVIMDVGDSLDIHPKPKKPVGDRLALLALAKNYGKKDLVFSGPLFKEVSFKEENAIISFDHVGSGLTYNGEKLKYFEIAGNDKKFYKAFAEVIGNKVIVNSEKVSNPRYVRYGWKNYLTPNFVNKEGLPASSFSSLINPFSQ